MMLKKMQYFALTVLTLVVLNCVTVYLFFYLCVFNFPADGGLARLGEEYQGAAVLDTGGDGDDQLFLVKTASGGTHLLVMKSSAGFPGRYHWLPDSTVVVPSEQLPYSCTIRTLNTVTSVQVGEGSRLDVICMAGSYPAPLESAQLWAPLALLAVELFLWWVAARINNGGFSLPQEEEFVPYAERTASRAVPSRPNAGLEDEASTPAAPLKWYSLRSGIGHPAQRISAKQLLLPLLSVPFLIAAGFAAVYWGFHFFVFSTVYEGDPAVLGPGYQGARVLEDADWINDQRGLTLKTASGETHLILLTGSPIHPGRYSYRPKNTRVVDYDPAYPFFPSSSSSQLLPGLVTGYSVTIASKGIGSSYYAEAEYFAYFVWVIAVWGLMVYISTKIKPREEKPDTWSVLDGL